jgi:hypothetical protein
MNTLQLVTFLRENILDDTGGEGVDWTTHDKDSFDSIQLRWGNEELIANINEAVRVVYRRTHPIKDLGTLDIVAGTEEYDIPSYVLEVNNMKLSTGKSLEKTDVDALWDLQSFFTDQEEPRYFIVDMGQNSIRLYPNPIADDTLSYFYTRLPKVELDWTEPDREPELRNEFHIPMLFYAAFLCYSKDEANTLDPRRAATMSAQFDLEFPFLSAYSTIRKSKTANRPVGYGGIKSAKYRNSGFRTGGL